MSIFNTILEVIFPSKCLSCGKKGENLCLKCLNESRPTERESANWIYPLFDYRDPKIKKSITLMKYKNKKNIADIFGNVLYDRIIEELSELSLMENFRESIIIPIPLSNKRLHERGYNQAELLCKQIIKINNLRHLPAVTEVTAGDVDIKLEKNVLIKIKEIEHQARIQNRKERLKNIIGSFGIKNKELIKNKNIILIDDVTTTGSTLEEAKKILKNAGARKIIAFTIAH